MSEVGHSPEPEDYMDAMDVDGDVQVSDDHASVDGDEASDEDSEPESIEKALDGSIAIVVARGTSVNDDEINSDDSEFEDEADYDDGGGQKDNDFDDSHARDDHDLLGRLRAELLKYKAELRDYAATGAQQAQDVANLRSEIGDLNESIARMQDEINDRDETITDQQNEIETLTRRLEARKHTRQRTRRTWPDMLHRLLTNGLMAGGYDAVYKTMCQEENMSVVKYMLHPNLKLRSPRQIDLDTELVGPEAALGAIENDYQAARILVQEVVQDAAQAVEEVDEGLFVRDDQAGAKDEDAPPVRSFKDMTPEIQAKIIRLVLVYPGRLIHCISRLDPYCPPRVPPRYPPSPNSSDLPKRFWTRGRMGCSIEYATKPKDLLSILLVCKSLHFLGVHAFYGLNTFAFSSLGEFGRFCEGIGLARLQRIQHIEIFWQGNQTLTFKPDKDGKYTSRRTFAASRLLDMSRLKTMVIHIKESGKRQMRRSHEKLVVREWLVSKTKGQPNDAMLRALRTLQGLDYILGLRGMRHILFYDIEKHFTMGVGRHPIRD
ncbi:hypothetical protein ACHAQH_005595 [Verticillium albo-atrum]